MVDEADIERTRDAARYFRQAAKDLPSEPGAGVSPVIHEAMRQSFISQAVTLEAEADAMEREQFCARFKAYMIERAGTHFDDGESIADYADEVAPTYWETDWQRKVGPEECAHADMSYWGED